MKKLFLPLLASFALPTAVYAESVWLIIHKGWGEHGSLVNLEMKDMAQCELQGAKWMSSKKLVTGPFQKLNLMSYKCLEGK